DETGTTAVFHAAAWEKWYIVLCLLNNHGADKMISDQYGQTVFSKLMHATWFSKKVWPSYYEQFVKLLNIYSLDELNALCKDMRFDRNVRDSWYPKVFVVNSI